MADLLWYQYVIIGLIFAWSGSMPMPGCSFGCWGRC